MRFCFLLLPNSGGSHEQRLISQQVKNEIAVRMSVLYCTG